MSEATKKARKPYFRMTAAQKVEAGVLWRAGEMTSAQIATKLGVPDRAMSQFTKSCGFKKGDLSAELEEKRAAVVEQALTLDPLVHARRVFDTKNETYRISEMLRKLVASEIIKCRQDGRKLGTIQNEIKTIREAAAAIKTCREEAFAVLGIRPEDQGDEALPDLTVTDLTEDDIADLQAMPPMDGMGDLPDEPFGDAVGDPGDIDEGGG